MRESDQQPPQQPVDQPPHVGSPTEGEHLRSPEPGHPADETEPIGGTPERAHEHPEDIDDTTPDKQSSP
jgi:hypothetical protein